MDNMTDNISEILHLCWDFELLDDVELEENAYADLDEVSLWAGEVTESEVVYILPVYIIRYRDGGSL